MKSDFLLAITQLSAEKNLPKEVVFRVVESALVSAYKKDSFADENISVKIHPATGEVKIYRLKTVVETPTDPKKELSLEQALKLNKEAKLGDEVVTEEITPKHAGRIAAQTAKQVVLQRLREAERELVFEEFAGKEGTIVSGIVQRMDPKQITVDLGKAEAILPGTEQVRGERYRIGQRIKVYLMEVSRTSKWPRLIVSRSHRDLLARLLELEIPEVQEGTVEIKSIAREAGSRSKVAVAAKQQGIDPVGSCVGLRGVRIQNIVNELNGERIDIVQWHPETAAFISNALSPAQVLSAELGQGQAATVVVPDRQLSLAIGKEGQNARLAAKLTGWKIDIKSASEAEAEKAAREAERAAQAAAAAPPVEAAAPAEAPAAAVAEAEKVAAVAAEVMPQPVAEAAEPAAAKVEAVPAPTPQPVAEKRAPVETAPPAPKIRFAEDLALPPRVEVNPKKEKKRKTGKPGEEEREKAKAAAKEKKGRKPWMAEVEEQLEDYEYLKGSKQ
ncbi:MAG: transcription termination factor NusA [Dehalococcoidia bacterium]|nr:transcription termination factor NusA [Dehalococcoidia bacterium]